MGAAGTKTIKGTCIFTIVNVVSRVCDCLKCPNMYEYIIRNEKDAFEVLEKAIRHELGDKVLALKFESWPVIQIKIEGPGYDSTISSNMAGALVELQHAINRTFARVAHKSTNARSLSAEERQSLQLKAKVEKGSSLINIDLGPFADKLVTEVLGKMTPEMIAITVVGTAIAGASLLAYKAFLKNRTEEKAIDAKVRERLALSEEETKRLEVFAAAMKREPELRHAVNDFDIARNDIVRASRDADSITMNSIQLDKETAKVVGIAKRAESQEIQLNDSYLILGVDFRNQNEVRLKLKAAKSGKEFYASFLDHSLHQEQIGLLQAAEWGRELVYLSINGTQLRGEITTATVVAVAAKPKAA